MKPTKIWVSLQKTTRCHEPEEHTVSIQFSAVKTTNFEKLFMLRTFAYHLTALFPTTANAIGQRPP
jgi:hypothetical protein